jgi:hypothetical protein
MVQSRRVRRARHAGHGDLRPDANRRSPAVRSLAVGQQHGLSRLRLPVARAQREVIDRAARRRAADHGHLLRWEGRAGLARWRWHEDSRGDRGLGERPGRRRHPGQTGGDGQLSRRGLARRGHPRAMLGGERAFEWRAGVGERADHDRLHLAAGHPARHGAKYRRRPPASMPLAIWPSATWIVRLAYRPAREPRSTGHRRQAVPCPAAATPPGRPAADGAWRARVRSVPAAASHHSAGMNPAEICTAGGTVRSSRVTTPASA